jgi:hypothetical protein
VPLQVHIEAGENTLGGYQGERPDRTVHHGMYSMLHE